MLLTSVRTMKKLLSGNEAIARGAWEAGVLFAKTEGIIPAPETCHAIRGAIIEATREPEEPKTILFNFSGHGLIDMASYDKYFAGELEDFDYPAEQIAESMAKLPKL